MAKISFEYDSETNAFKVVAERDVRVYIERTSSNIDNRLTPQEVYEHVTEYLKLTKEQVLSKSMASELVKARKLISYYLVAIWNYQPAAASRMLGYNTHNVARYHSNKVIGYLETGNVEYLEDIKNLNQILKVRT